MKPKRLPSRKVLLSLFWYDGRHLIWKSVPKNKKFLLGKRAGTLMSDGYHSVKIDGEMYKSHRIIFKMLTGKEPPQIDHKNRKRADNKERNIRASNVLKNHRNRTNTRYPNLPAGVTYARDGKRYLAFVHVGKYRYLGTFTNKKEAARVSREARRDR